MRISELIVKWSVYFFILFPASGRGIHQLKDYGVQPPYAAASEAPWTLERFKRDLEVEIHSASATELEFDLININVALANTLRRIMLVDVPTMAIEKVFMYQNTCPIQDDVLSHRIGLIPLDVNPQLFSHLTSPCPESDDPETLTENECLLFELHARCSASDGSSKGGSRSASGDEQETKKRGFRNVYAHEMRWIPIGQQARTFPSKQPCVVRSSPDEPGILLAKLAPGQELHFRCLAVKGAGKDHAKFSPVATASYRMHPRIALTRKVEGELAFRLQSCFPKGVIEVDPKSERARVAEERLEVRSSREVMRDPELKDCVTLGLDSTHFIFSVESTGAMTPVTIVEQALLILIQKCDVIDIALSGVDE